MWKDDLNVHVLQSKTDVAQNLINDFFPTLTVRGPFHRKDFKWKKYGGTGLISEKLSMQNLTKEQKQPLVASLQHAIFHNIFILWLWLRTIRRSVQGI